MTPDQRIAGRRILIVEDEYLLAEDLRQELVDAGAEVLGPVASVAAAIGVIDAEPTIDMAVLDVNLGEEMVFPAADALARRNVPFAFITGYDAATLPPRYADVQQLGKPVHLARIKALIAQLVAPA
ncbi:MAG: response regulator [Sphingomonas sp.]